MKASSCRQRCSAHEGLTMPPTLLGTADEVIE
jgi:hypothetical protein